MSIACVALFAAFANGESLIPQGANVAPPTGRGAKFPPTGNLRCERKNFGIISTTYMCMLDKIRAKRDEIYAIARKHKAEKLWVFGSCARKEERPDSDVDFLVRFGDDASFGAQVRLGDDFNAYFSRKVDVVSDRGLSPYIGKIIRKEAVAI